MHPFVPSRSLLRYLRQISGNIISPNLHSNACVSTCRRTFASSSIANSGHSKWATIKHDKAKADMKRTKARSMIIGQIDMAVRLYGPNPESNPRLKTILALAKQHSTPKEVVEAAIKRGQGLSTTGKPLETLTIEALFPSAGVAAIIECETESKAKTLMEVRTVITKSGGSVGPCKFLFERVGIVRLKGPLREELTADEVMMRGLEVEGFMEVVENSEESDEGLELVCEPNAVKALADEMEALKCEIESVQLLWRPMEVVERVGEEEREGVLNAISRIEEVPGVQTVYLNMDKAEASDEGE